MTLDKAVARAAAHGYSLAWDKDFKVYTLRSNTDTAFQPVGIRASWLAIISEDEFITKYLMGD